MKKKASELTLQDIKAQFNYDPDNGYFTWKDAKRSKSKIGTRAGGNKEGVYRYLSCQGATISEQRAAFLYMTGSLPTKLIDHIDGNRSNNAWENLREFDHVANGQNRKRASSHSKSQTLGVWLHRKDKWRAQISVRGKRRELGLFDTMEAASAAYRTAKAELHPAWVPKV